MSINQEQLNELLDKELYYCPYCGCNANQKTIVCKGCGKEIIPQKANGTLRYYEKISNGQYGVRSYWRKILDDEIQENPLFDLNLEADCKVIETKKSQHNALENLLKTLRKPIKIDLDEFKKYRNSQNQYAPKCPICNSPHITKISTTRKLAGAATFGIFSKTARSQWVCKTCGSKF